MMDCDDNPPSDVLVKIEERKNAYFFLCDYIEAKYGEPYTLNLEDNLHEDSYPSPPSHKYFLQDILELEKDDEWIPRVGNINEMYDVSIK